MRLSRKSSVKTAALSGEDSSTDAWNSQHLPSLQARIQQVRVVVERPMHESSQMRVRSPGPQ